MKKPAPFPMPSKFPLIELLEPRLAPAFVLHYVDHDGDAVTVAVSRGDAANAEVIFDSSGAQLQKLGLNDPSFIGADVSVTAEPTNRGGDGRADVGWLQTRFSVSVADLRSPSLGTVRIDGTWVKLPSPLRPASLVKSP